MLAFLEIFRENMGEEKNETCVRVLKREKNVKINNFIIFCFYKIFHEKSNCFVIFVIFTLVYKKKTCSASLRCFQTKITFMSLKCFQTKLTSINQTFN